MGLIDYICIITKHKDMKKLILTTFSIVASVLVNAQVIQIKVSETQPYVKWTKTDSQDNLRTPEWVGYKETVDGVYIYDLDNKTYKLFINGNLVLESFIDKVVRNNNNNNIKIECDVPSKEVPDIILKTEFDINLETNESSLTWYNPYGNYTRTQKNTKNEITILEKNPL